MKKIFSVLLSLICLLNFTTSVDAASSTISAYKSSTEYEYIDGLPIYYNRAGNYKLYVLDNDTYFDSSTTLRDPERVSGGFEYIINNSSPTSNSDKNYYITQVAILWYEDYLNGNDDNISSSLKNYITNNTGNTVCYYINKLVNNAKKYSSDESNITFDDKEVTFYKSGNYYYSNVIDFTVNDLSSKPTIRLYDAPSSATIVNEDLSKDGDNSFQIRIPVNKFNDYEEEDFEVYISGNTSNSSYYKYSVNYSDEEVIYARSYSSNSENVDAILPINMGEISDNNIRIKVIDEDGDIIENIKYNIYQGDCKNSTCDSDDYVNYFVTKGLYNSFSNLRKGTYTLVRKTSTKYDLAEKEVIYVKDTTSTQTFVIEEENNTREDNYIYIYNTLNDSDNIIKIYKSNGTLLNSYRSNNMNYKIELNDGYYYIVDSKNLLEVDFKIEDCELYAKVGANYKEMESLDLNDFLKRYPIDNDNIINDNINKPNIDTNKPNIDTNKPNNNVNDKNENIHTDKDGNIHIDNLDGVDSIDISQKIETNTDVKVDWISNIIDCPKTSISSTIKYIIGASILVAGILLTVRNVKKSKNNI